MKKQDLEQIYYLSRELKMWERELQTLRGKSLTGSPLSGSGSSPLGSHSDKVADRAERIISLEERVNAKKSEIQAARDAAVAFVMTIPDSLTRQIVYYRCVSLMGWRRVAYEVGGKNTEESVKKHYQRFVAKL